MEKQQDTFYVLFAHRINWWAFVTSIFEVVEKSNYSHCAIYYNDTIYEAEFPASRKLSYTKWLKPYEEKLSFKMPVNNPDEAIKFLDSLLGKPYSITQLILVGLRRLLPNSKLLDKLTLNKIKHLDCSEFVALFQEKFCGVKYDISLDAVGLVEVRVMCELIKRKLDGNSL